MHPYQKPLVDNRQGRAGTRALPSPSNPNTDRPPHQPQQQAGRSHTGRQGRADASSANHRRFPPHPCRQPPQLTGSTPVPTGSRLAGRDQTRSSRCPPTAPPSAPIAAGLGPPGTASGGRPRPLLAIAERSAVRRRPSISRRLQSHSAARETVEHLCACQLRGARPCATRSSWTSLHRVRLSSTDCCGAAGSSAASEMSSAAALAACLSSRSFCTRS